MVGAAGAAAVFYFAHLETVPVSGRTRFNYYSADAVKQIAVEQYKMLLCEFARNRVRVLPSWDIRSGLCLARRRHSWDTPVADLLALLSLCTQDGHGQACHEETDSVQRPDRREVGGVCH